MALSTMLVVYILRAELCSLLVSLLANVACMLSTLPPIPASVIVLANKLQIAGVLVRRALSGRLGLRRDFKAADRPFFTSSC
jgi:hypothetical protein